MAGKSGREPAAMQLSRRSESDWQGLVSEVRRRSRLPTYGSLPAQARRQPGWLFLNTPHDPGRAFPVIHVSARMHPGACSGRRGRNVNTPVSRRCWRLTWRAGGSPAGFPSESRAAPRSPLEPLRRNRRLAGQEACAHARADAPCPGRAGVCPVSAFQTRHRQKIPNSRPGSDLFTCSCGVLRPSA